MTSKSKSRILAYVKSLGVISVLSLVSGIVLRFIRPFWHAYRIDNWLRSEPHYINNYSRTISKSGHFKFEVELSGDDGPDLIIENVHLEAPVRIEARKKLDPGLMGNLIDESNEFNLRRRRDLQSSIEALLSSTPGVFSYRDFQDEPVGFEEADSILLEYRLYPDGLTQHELMNGIVRIANALLYVDRREQLLIEELEDER